MLIHIVKQLAKNLNDKFGSQIEVDENTKTFIDDPVMKKRIESIQTQTGLAPYETNSKSNDERKYFRENQGVTYASGISVRLYDEERFY